MRFDSEKGDRGRVFDANGEEIFYAIRGDTDTGIVECLIIASGGVETAISRHPAPLTVKPLEFKIKTIADKKRA